MNSIASRAQLLLERDRARERQADRDAELLQLHQAAVAALASPEAGGAVLAQARARVALWHERQLCDPAYVRYWDEVLSLDADALSTAVLAQTPQGRAMRQNSPFGFLATRSSP